VSFKKRIEQGIEGKYEGLKNGLSRINKYIYGIQRRYYYLIGALSGAGKTMLSDFMLLNALRDAEEKGINVNIFYYSYEINEGTKKANWLSNHIYNKYGIVIPPEVINGYGENRLTEEQKEIVDKEIPYIDKLFEKVNFRFDPINPTGIYKELYNFAEETGSFITEEYLDEHNNIKRRIVEYKPNDPESYTIIVLDHYALMKSERGFTLKENIDKMSEYFIWLRNICGYTILAVQQYNQSLNTVERLKFKGVDLTPQQNDFKDSGNPYQDCDVALGLMNPWKMDMKECLKYNLQFIQENFRLLKVIKNRNGKDNVAIGLFYKPESGSFAELKPAQEMSLEDYNKLDELRKR